MARDWTNDDEQKLLELYQSLGPKWKEISRILDRSYESVRMKWRTRNNVDKTVPDKDYVNLDVKGNYLIADSRYSKRVLNLDDLIDVCGINMDEWTCEHHIVNKWEVGAKTSQKSLSFNNGVITGNIEDEGKLTIAPLIQVKAWFIRNNPIEINPQIQPIQVKYKLQSSNKPKDNREYETALIVPDLQFGFMKASDNNNDLIPFHDRKALDLVLSIAKKIKPDLVVFLGDILDLPEWTDHFVKSPDFYFTTQPAIIELNWWLGQLRLILPQADIYILEGNHDDRLNKALIKHLIFAYQLKPANEINLAPSLSIPRLLDFRGLKINWIDNYPDSSLWINDELICEHGKIARINPGDSAKATLSGRNISTIFGHIHRRESVSQNIQTRQGNKIIEATCPGCLCKIDGSVPGHDLSQNWSQGIAVVYYDDKYYDIKTININNSNVIFNSKKYEGTDKTNIIRHETGWDNI